MGDKITVRISEDEAARRAHHLLDRLRLFVSRGFSTRPVRDTVGRDSSAVSSRAAPIPRRHHGQMIYHSGWWRARKRAAGHRRYAVYVLSVGKDEALRQCRRFFKEAGAEAIKLEGGVAVQESIRAIVDAGCVWPYRPTPQSGTSWRFYKVQGRKGAARSRAARRHGGSSRRVRGGLGGHAARFGR